jgi:hypothetical protein
MASDKRSTNLRGLLLLNAALLAVLAAVTFGSNAGAQAARGRGEYTMVEGGAMGSDAGIIWIADVANQEIVAMTYNNSTKRLDGVGYRNLATDAGGAVRPNRPTN